MKAAFHHAVVALRRAQSVVVCAHVRPDGDAVGSVLALTLALRSIGIPAIPTLADDREPSKTYEWLPGFALYTPAADLAAPAVFVALDTPVPERLGVARGLSEAAQTLIVIDHHADASAYGHINVFDPRAAATGQLIWQLIEAFDIQPSPEVALCCYTALVTDTGRFQYQNTTSAALRDAANMLDVGVDASEVARLVYQNRTVGSLAIEALAMSRLTLTNSGHVAYTWLTDEDFAATGALAEEAEFLPDAVRVLGGVDVVMVLRERGEEVRVNLRSKTGFDVGTLARHFGGGGHHAASGLTWNKPDFAAFLSAILPLLPGGSSAR